MSLFSTLGHHVRVARAALEAEKQGPHAEKRTADELQFMPAALEVMETPASPLARTVALTIIAFFSIAVGWAVFGQVDIIATAQGKIIPSARIKVIQPAENGTIAAIHVEDGQRVKAGDILIELKPTEALADSDRLHHEWLAVRVEAARLSALLTDDPDRTFAPPKEAPTEVVELHRTFMLSAWRRHKAKLASLKSDLARQKAAAKTISAEIGRIEKVLPTIRERVRIREGLLESQVVARSEFLDLQERLLDQEGQLNVEHRRQEEAEAAVAAARNQLAEAKAEFRRAILAQLAEAHQKADSLAQDLIKAEEGTAKTTLKAPVDGVVQQLAVHTVGGVVIAAEKLMVVVPADSALEVEARVHNKDIGFVHEGHEAEIKVDSFPFTKFGTIPGKVRTISKDAVEDDEHGLVYPVRVEMERATMLVGKEWVNLSPGMAITLEIKTGKRRLIDYLLAPLQEYRDEAMRER